jgi:GTP 3',8-cyclase
VSKSEKPAVVYWLDNTLYLNITNRCSNSCFFCLKNYKRGVGGFNLKLQQEPTVAQIKEELGKVLNTRFWAGVVFCGFGEPTERLDVLLETTRWIRQHYGKPLVIRVDTNGHGCILNGGTQVVAELKAAGVDRVSVSLNAGDEKTYTDVCRPSFGGAYDNVLDFIRQAKSLLQVEATAVRIPEVDMKSVQAAAEDLGVALRVREYIPGFY